MICDRCKNRTICKYYAFLSDAPLEFTIESCEKYIGKSNTTNDHMPSNAEQTLFSFKQPIDYEKINGPEETVNTNIDEERIEVDLSEETHSNVLSITDILMGNGDDNNGSTKED